MNELENKNTNENFFVKLANIIYNLDTKVYVATESDLGRQFQGSREKNVEEIVKLLSGTYPSYKLRSEIAAINNMIRTIKDKETREALQKEYEFIIHELNKKENFIDSVEIVNQKLAGLNESNFSGRRRKKDEHLVICISRTHSSAGADIGFALAENLGINYYDVEVLKGILYTMDRRKDIDWLVEKAATDPKYAKLVKTAQNMEKNGFSFTRSFSRYHGLPKEDADFFNVSRFLVELAKQEDFVVIGRCADTIFANNNVPHLSIFITAPIDTRARHLMKTEGVSNYRKAVKEILKEDKKHSRYYRKYTGKLWGLNANYDLALNSSSYGIEESVELIKRIINT